MFAVKFEMNGQSVKIKYSHDVFTDSVHETRAGAEAAIRRHYRDFTGDGATIEGADMAFTVLPNEPRTLTVHFYIEEV